MKVKTSTSLTAGPEKNCGNNRCVLILGLGNILLKDEGIGVHVAVELQKQKLTGNVEVIDGGTAGLDILLLAADVDKLVIVDALRTGKKPGTIYKICLKSKEKDGLTQIFNQTKQSKISLHQVGLLDVLLAAEKLKCLPGEIIIVGVEPGEVDCGLELTQQVKRKVPEVIEKILEEIKDDIHTN